MQKLLLFLSLILLVACEATRVVTLVDFEKIDTGDEIVIDLDVITKHYSDDMLVKSDTVSYRYPIAKEVLFKDSLRIKDTLVTVYDTNRVDTVVYNIKDSVRFTQVVEYDTLTYLNYFGYNMFTAWALDTLSPYKVLVKEHSAKLTENNLNIKWGVANLGPAFNSTGNLSDDEFGGVGYDVQVYSAAGDRLYNSRGVFNEGFDFAETNRYQTIFGLSPYTAGDLVGGVYRINLYYKSFDNLFMSDSLIGTTLEIFNPDTVVDEPSYPMLDTMIIQAEDFEDYYDTDPMNNGLLYYDSTDVYRVNEAVDIEYNGIGGYSVGWFKEGEWLEYSILILRDGYYDFNFHCSTNFDGRYIELIFDGQDMGQLDIPNSGDWFAWEYTSFENIYIKRGLYTLRVISGGNVNFDKLEVLYKQGSD